jgi:hypothetical protein
MSAIVQPVARAVKPTRKQSEGVGGLSSAAGLDERRGKVSEA